MAEYGLFRQALNNIFPYRDFLYVFQLEDYDITRYLSWVKTRWDKRSLEKNKSLVWTKKTKAIFTISLLMALFTVVGITVAMAWYTDGLTVLLIIPLILIIGVSQLFFIFLVLASLFLWPLETMAKASIVMLAILKLRRLSNIKIITVTGSYGKTTTKEIIATLLSYKYKTLKTSKSCNTPFSIASIVLKELSDYHEMFVVEMGTCKRGDIRMLTRMLKPKIGVLTSIGKEYNERFKGMENVIKTNGELFEELQNDAIAITNADSNECMQTTKSLARPVITYSIYKDTNADIWAENIQTTPEGRLNFEIHSKLPANQFTQEVTVNLLGRHNVANTLAAVCVALSCKMTSGEIKQALSEVKPVEHRLQIIKGANNTTVIDDAYNSNPNTITIALEVLKDYPGNQKIIITPGLTGQGENQFKENERMGTLIAGSADWVFIVGNTNVESILKGLQKKNFPKDRVYPVKTLEEALKALQIVVHPKDVILFENDLPDQYVS